MTWADGNYVVPSGSTYGVVGGFVVIAVVLTVVLLMLLYVFGERR